MTTIDRKSVVADGGTQISTDLHRRPQFTSFFPSPPAILKESVSVLIWKATTDFHVFKSEVQQKDPTCG